MFQERFDAVTEEVLCDWANEALYKFDNFPGEVLKLPANWSLPNNHLATEFLPEITNDLFGLKNYSPKITISNKDCTVHQIENIFDRLGIYKFINPGESGEIVLFEKCIDAYSQLLYTETTHLRNLFIDQLDCKKYVYKVVLFHEIGHWISHWGSDSLGNKWSDDFWELAPNPNDLLEGIAQFFTYNFILHDSDVRRLKFTFEHLLWGQPDPYHKHIDIHKIRISDIDSVFKAVENIRLQPITSQTLSTFISFI